MSECAVTECNHSAGDEQYCSLDCLLVDGIDEAIEYVLIGGPWASNKCAHIPEEPGSTTPRCGGHHRIDEYQQRDPTRLPRAATYCKECNPWRERAERVDSGVYQAAIDYGRGDA